MQNKSIFALLCCCLLAFFSCKNDKAAETTTAEAPKSEKPAISLEKSWNMAASAASDLPPQGEGTSLQRGMSYGWYGEKGRSGYGLTFFPNGLLVELSGQKYKVGKWTADDANKSLKVELPTGKNEETVGIEYLSSDSLQLKVGKGSKPVKVGFRTDGAVYNNPEENPYHPSNNQWRIKPTSPETDEQIKARLKNHLSHFVKILEGGTKHQLKVVSFKHSPSCLQQFNGGVGMISENKLSTAWTDCFYDKKDVQKAHNMMTHALRSEASPKTDSKNNWVQNNLIIFKFLLETI